MKLLDTLNSAKVELNPLPKHYLVKHADIYLREQYAILLASLITDNGSVSPNQGEYFASLLHSLELQNDISQYYALAQKIDKDTIITLVKQLDKSAHTVLLFDAIILLRIDHPLTKEQIQAISALADVFRMTDKDVVMSIFWARNALGLKGKANTDYLRQLKLFTLSYCRELINEVDFCFLTSDGVFIKPATPLFSGYNYTDKNIKKFTGRNKIAVRNSLKANGVKLTTRKSNTYGMLLSNTIDFNRKYYKFKVTCDILPLPKSLLNWKSFFAELYPAQPYKPTK